MLAGQQLDLVRPRKIRQQFTDFDGIGGKRRDRGVNKCNAILAHWSEADCIRWNRYRMTVLHPEHYSLARRGSGKTGIPIGRPGVGVMRGGQRTAARFFGQSSFVEYIERVFDHIVPGGTHDVQKQLATKSVELKPLAYFPTVENDCARARLAALTPFGQNLAVAGKQRQPAGNLAGSVPRPIIHSDELRV